MISNMKLRLSGAVELLLHFSGIIAQKMLHTSADDERMIRTNKVKLGEMVIFQLRIDCYHTK